MQHGKNVQLPVKNQSRHGSNKPYLVVAREVKELMGKKG